jgi:hypothetical protein
MSPATKADFDRVNVHRMLAGVEQTCFAFSGALDAKARELTATGDVAGSAVLSLLADICSYGMRADDLREPFGPQWTFGDRRTAAIEDLNDEQIALLGDVYESITIAELRARVADVLFVRRRHHKYARVALDAYLESAGRLMSPDDWVDGSHRYQRALAISGAVKPEQNRVVEHLTQEAESRRGDAGYFSARVMEGLLDQRLGDPARWASLANDAAKRASADRDWDRAREYLLLLAQWSRRAQKPDDAAQALRDAAESYVKLADAARSRSLESAFLECAIQLIRAVPGTQARVAELHQRLVAAEKEALKEFKAYSASVNLGDAPARARAHVARLPLVDAIFGLACMWWPSPVAKIREAVIENAKQHVIFSALPRTLHNREGKVIANRGSLLVGSPNQQEEAIRHAMFERAAQQREHAVASTLAPAVAQVADEHYVRVRTLLPITSASAFVPAGRAEVIAVNYSCRSPTTILAGAAPVGDRPRRPRGGRDQR